MKHPQRWIWFLAPVVALGGPLAAGAADIEIPAKVQLVKQDKKAGFVGKLAKFVGKPLPKGSTFPAPASDPTSVGGSLLFYKVATPGFWSEIALPNTGWTALGNPPGSKGYKYKGAGTPADPCKSVLVKTTVIKATCKGPTSSDSPAPYSLPVGPTGAAFQLEIGVDRFCAESSAATGADVKSDDATKGLYKAINANAPVACPNPVGSASKAFLSPSQGLLD